MSKEEIIRQLRQVLSETDPARRSELLQSFSRIHVLPEVVFSTDFASLEVEDRQALRRQG